MPIRPKTLRPSWLPERKPWSGLRTREEVDIYRTVYNTPQWRKVRDIARQREPICRACGVQPTHTIDHIIPIKQGGAVYDLDNLQGLCKTCNASKTSKQQGKGGAP